MSDIHVLDGTGNGGVRVVFHFAVPSANNDVAVNWRTALVNSGLGGSTAMAEGTGPGQIATAEKSQLEAGEVHEYPVEFPVRSGGTAAAELRVSLRALYTARKGAVLASIQDRLRWFGHTESEA